MSTRPGGNVSHLNAVSLQKLGHGERLAKAQEHLMAAMQRLEAAPELAVKHFKQILHILHTIDDTETGEGRCDDEKTAREMQDVRATAEAHLGDILIHNERFDEAELYLLRAVAMHTALMANESPIYNHSKHRKALKDLGYVQYSKGKRMDNPVAQARCYRVAVGTFESLVRLVSGRQQGDPSSPIAKPNDNAKERAADTNDILGALNNIAAIQYNGHNYALAMETFYKIICVSESEGLSADAAKKSMKMANKRHGSHVRIAAAQRIQCAFRCYVARQRLRHQQFRAVLASAVVVSSVAASQVACVLLGLGEKEGSGPSEVSIMIDTMKFPGRYKMFLAQGGCLTVDAVRELHPSDFAVMGIKRKDAEEIRAYTLDPEGWGERHGQRSTCGSSRSSVGKASPLSHALSPSPVQGGLTPPLRALGYTPKGGMVKYAELAGMSTPDSMSLSVGRSPCSPALGFLGKDWQDSPQQAPLSTEHTLPPLARQRRDTAKMMKLELGDE
jgi:tetratricopeptide (TPR) repeat protein